MCSLQNDSMMQPNLTYLTNLTLCNISATSLFSGVPNLLLIPAEFLLCLHLEIFPWNVSAEGDDREKPPCHLCQSLTFLSPVTNLLVQRRLNEMGLSRFNLPAPSSRLEDATSKWSWLSILESFIGLFCPFHWHFHVCYYSCGSWKVWLHNR